MNSQEQIMTTSYANPSVSPIGQHQGDQGPRIGLRIDLFTSLPGKVELEPASDHRLMIHAGKPVRGACRLSRFVYTRGDVDILPAGLSDAWEPFEATRSLILQVSPWLLRRAAEDIGLDPDRAGLEHRHQFKDPQIEHIAWALDAERRSDYANGLLYTDCLGMALAVHLLGHYTKPLRLPRGLSRPQMRRLTAYIEENLDQNLSLAQLAEITGVSASHLKTLFKQSMGVPVHEYVIQRRVARAKTLLLKGDLPASQVALEAGFAHQSHMARCMRRILGVTPTTLVHSWRTR